MSPTKRGILVTPGTAANRRKTVTFGANIEHDLKKESKSGIPDDCPGKFPSPWVVPQSEDTLPVTRRTNLMQTLENARESTKKPSPTKHADEEFSLEPLLAKDIQPIPPLEPNSKVTFKKSKEPERKNLVLGVAKTEDADLDFTVDLNEPRSQSGRHWKREYEKYHEEAQERMGHLIRYKHLAKDYAKIKDDESMEMREQLEREQQNVVNMESYIAKLISAIEERSKSGDNDMTPELTKELARQTALAVQYKEQVEQFRAALEKSGVVQVGRQAETSLRAERAMAEQKRELEKARDELKESASLRSEAKRLKLDLSVSERKVAKFKEDNLVMAQQLEQCKADLERSERERKTLDEQAKKRGDTLQALQRDYESLRQLVKKQRSDADLQLQQRQEQVATLRKELISTRYIADSSESEKLVRSLQQKIAAHDKIVQEYEIQISKLRNQELNELNHFDLDVGQNQPKRSSSYLRKVFGGSSHRIAAESESYELPKTTVVNQQEDETEEQDQTINVDHILDSMTSEIKAPVIKYDYTQKENRSMLPKYTQSTTPRSSPSVLREITNSAPKIRVTEVDESLNVATPGISKKFADLSIHSPAIPSPSISRATSRNKLSGDRNAKASPRPAIVNLSDTPAKSRQISNLVRGASGSDRASSLTNRGSLRTRTTLPPERAAAAKARLEQRNREKQQQQKRMQDIS